MRSRVGCKCSRSTWRRRIRTTGRFEHNYGIRKGGFRGEAPTSYAGDPGPICGKHETRDEEDFESVGEDWAAGF
eukprot:931769-Amphidinium_carterae.1